MKVLAVIDVIDFPKTCKQCRFKQGALNPADELEWLCELNDEHIDLYEASEWCPLRKIPQKESEKHREEIEDWTGLAYSQGWNDCIDEIVKETLEGDSNDS